jgi:Outer membrane protein/protective antigen OMA87
MRRSFIAALAIFLFIFSAAIFGEELTPAFVAEHADLFIARIVYEGNQRTKPAAMAELVGFRPGMRLSEIDPDAATQRLLKSGLFGKAELSCELAEEGVVIRVKVTEKWSFIPVPFAAVGSESWSAGLAILDFNALGMRKTMLVGALATNLGLEGALVYVDPRFAGSDISLSVYGSGGRNSKKAVASDGGGYASYLEELGVGGLRVEYPGEGALKAKIECSLHYSGLGEESAALYGLEEEALSLDTAAGLTYDGQRSVDYFTVGPYLKANYKHGFPLEGYEGFDSLEASGLWTAPLFRGGFIELGASGRYGDIPLQFQTLLSGKGFRLLPQSGSYSSKALAAYVSLEEALIRPSWGVITLGAFYEGGVYETGLDAAPGLFLFHGPGGGLRLYLNKVALPAMGIDAGYNIPAGRFVFSAYIGLSLY